MNAFDQKLREHGLFPLRRKEISTLTVVMGHKCILSCRHCYVEGSPNETEEMPLDVLNKFLKVLKEHKEIAVVNTTGGSPELNPHFRYFVESASKLGKMVMVASNLAVHHEPGMSDLPQFLTKHKVIINASLPHFTEEGVDRVRGKGTYKKVISALKNLNELGYGKDGSPLVLNLLYTPFEAQVSPDMQELEKIFKEKLEEMHGVEFNNLFTINNMPIGRFGKLMSEEEKNKYLKELEDKFNPASVENMMCRTSVSYGFDGKRAYDCDFLRVQDIPIDMENTSLEAFDYQALSSGKIITSPLCFMCTAGAGVGCSELF